MVDNNGDCTPERNPTTGSFVKDARGSLMSVQHQSASFGHPGKNETSTGCIDLMIQIQDKTEKDPTQAQQQQHLTVDMLERQRFLKFLAYEKATQARVLKGELQQSDDKTEQILSPDFYR